MATIAARRVRWNADRRFFTGMAAAMVVATFIGFAPTYYLSSLTGAPAVGPLVHLHGIIYTLWLLLFFAQTSLVTAGRTDIHRKLGMALAGFAIIVVLVGVLVAIESARLDHGPPDRHQPSFLAFPLANMVMFSAFTVAGVVYRKRADYHKRLMLLATMGLVITPLARISRMAALPFDPPAIGGMLLSDIFLAALVAFDIRRHGRLHPATLWAGGAYLISQPLRVAIGRSEAWQSFALALMG